MGPLKTLAKRPLTSAGYDWKTRLEGHVLSLGEALNFILILGLYLTAFLRHQVPSNANLQADANQTTPQKSPEALAAFYIVMLRVNQTKTLVVEGK